MDEQRPAIHRLTENEKVCLRRRLCHQTAKEMALDLGISPHAVEKRLKMARLKLGVGSSLAAARLLADAEGAGAVGAQPPDLSGELPAAHAEAAPLPLPIRWRRLPLVPFAGASIMTMLAALFTLIAPHASQILAPPIPPVVPDQSEAVVVLPADAPGPHVIGEPITERAEDVRMRAAGAEEVAAFARSSFHTTDKDGSGFIEQAEAPGAGVGVPIPPPAGVASSADSRVQWFAGRRGQAMWIANMDTDRDGRASEAEYVAWDVTIWRDHVPANWAWRH